jgi:hypothetical protein
MKIRLCLALSLLLPPIAALSQPPKNTTKPAASVAQNAYAKRVQIISDELKPQVAVLWRSFGEMEELNAALQKRAKRDGAPSSADKEEWDKQKSALSAIVQAIRANTKRLRGISPVPRSLRKIDNELVDASFEIETGLDSLMSWVATPSPEMNLQLGRQLRKGITSWSNALIALGRATDPAVKAKVYLED